MHFYFPNALELYHEKIHLLQTRNKCIYRLCSNHRLYFISRTVKYSTFLISQMSRFKHFVVVLSGLCGTYSETSKSVFLVTRLLPYAAVQYTCTSNKIKPLHQPTLFRCNFEVTQKSRYSQKSESMKTPMRNSPDVNRKPT